MFIQNEKYVSKGLAVSSIVLLILSLIMIFIAGAFVLTSLDYNVIVNDFQQYGNFSGWRIFDYVDINQIIVSVIILVVAGLFALLSQIFQIIIVYQWSRALNTNIENTRYTFHELKEKMSDKSKIEAFDIVDMRFSRNKVQVWAYWVYFVMLLVSYFSFGMYSWAALIGVIFLAIYIQSVFSIAKYLQEAKTQLYNFLGKNYLFNNRFIKDRNVGLFILFIIITFGIYWLYLIIKLSAEINDYLSWDIQTRESLLKENN